MIRKNISVENKEENGKSIRQEIWEVEYDDGRKVRFESISSFNNGKLTKAKGRKLGCY